MSVPSPKKEFHFFKRCRWCNGLMFIAELRIEQTQQFYHVKCYGKMRDYKYDQMEL